MYREADHENFFLLDRLFPARSGHAAHRGGIVYLCRSAVPAVGKVALYRAMSVPTPAAGRDVRRNGAAL